VTFWVYGHVASGEPPVAGELAHLWEIWARHMTGIAAHHRKFFIISVIFIFICHLHMAER
jgi:hypothetical protein